MLPYRLLLSALLPVGLGLAARRVWRKSERWRDVAERFGAGLPQVAHTPHSLTTHTPTTLWLHAASNGEITSARPMIEQALREIPNLRLVITVNSITARALVQSWALPHVSVRLAPVDFWLINRRFLKQVQPNALLTLENEMWPNRFIQCAARDIPVIVAGARMSASTAQTWSKYQFLLGNTAEQTLKAIRFLAPQDQASEDRFLALGVKNACLLPQMNLKSDVDLALPKPADDAELRTCFNRENTVLAASTHDGEDEIILQSFAALKAAQAPRPLKLILAPRHPKRATDIAQIAQRQGLTTSLRSSAQSAAHCDVYIADTLGEMALWYSLACVTFVGGSLVDKGGHTPFEPAQFGSAIVHGPHLSNHADAFKALAESSGSVEVIDTPSLSQALIAAFETPNMTADRAARASEALLALRHDTPASPEFWHAISDALNQPDQ